ncbi:MAG: PASTA domain-containing protein [candidate division Zixibacteria bacterium]|nr:PASTA domain-containing protein [candidate division Zixibacteria bacterium]
MPWWTRHGEEYAAPLLVGRSPSAVLSLLAPYEATYQLSERRFSADHPDGTILEQRPLPGAPIKRGRLFNLVISRGSELIDIPRVRGGSVRQAELMLEQVGLAIGGRAFGYEDSLPEGAIIGTIPGEGSGLTKGGVVNLVINHSPDAAKTFCPKLVGLNIEEARDTLRDRGLLVGSIDRRFDATLLPGTIVGQSVAPGDELTPGAEIDFVISRDR